jgi:hypothetical protein
MFAGQYFAADYFPSVWFAESDASGVPPELLYQPKPETGGSLLSRRRSGGWAKPEFPVAKTPTEDEETLILLLL